MIDGTVIQPVYTDSTYLQWSRCTTYFEIVCEFSHMTGHSNDKCFCICGYPEWHKLYRKPKPRTRNLNAQKKFVANVQGTADTSSVSFDNSGADIFGKDIYIAAQCEQIEKMIESSLKLVPNSPTNNSSWVGASSYAQVHLHICLIHILLINFQCCFVAFFISGLESST